MCSARQLKSASAGVFCYRKHSGASGIVLVCLLPAIALMIGVIAIDVAHVSSVRSELQNAADAAALAGAANIDVDDERCATDALAVAAQNHVDGHRLSNKVPGTRVTVSVTPSSRIGPGFVRVRASVTVQHILAPILGRYADTIAVVSAAGPAGTVNNLPADKAFPLAVSIDAIPCAKERGGLSVGALRDAALTDVVTLYVDSQSVKNAAFTSFLENPWNYEYLRKALDQSLGIQPQEPISTPSLSVGDDIFLCDGIVGQKHLFDLRRQEKLLLPQVVVLPVVAGYPQHKDHAEIVGFVGAKIIGATVDWNRGLIGSLDVKLIKNVRRLRSGTLPATGNLPNDSALTVLSPGALKLLRPWIRIDLPPGEAVHTNGLGHPPT